MESRWTGIERKRRRGRGKKRSEKEGKVDFNVEKI